MKKTTEILLSVIFAVYGALMAIFSSSFIGFEDLDKVMIYGIFLVISFIVLLYSYYFYLKKKYKGTIYLVYSKKDADVADTFKTCLRDRGYKCLPDDDSYKLGDNIYNRMERDLSQAKALLLIISENTKEVKLLNHAVKIMKKRKKKILPITIGDVKVPNNLYGILSTEYDPYSNKTIFLVLEALGESV